MKNYDVIVKRTETWVFYVNAENEEQATEKFKQGKYSDGSPEGDYEDEVIEAVPVD